jgi:hypothetical protein
MDEQLTIAPLPCCRIWASSCFIDAHTPRRFTAVGDRDDLGPSEVLCKRPVLAGSWAVDAWLLHKAPAARPVALVRRTSWPFQVRRRTLMEQLGSATV